MIKAFYCPRKEKVVEVEECYRCSQDDLSCQIFPEYLKWLSEDKDHSSKITVTKLLYCPRRAYFYSKVDYIIEPYEAYTLFRGSIVHSFLEKFKIEDCIVETEFVRKYKEIEIYGTPDKIDIKRGIIYDYKTITGRISDDYSLRWGNPHMEHIVQLHLYKWLVEDKFNIQKLVLIYIGSDTCQKYEIPIRKPEDKKKYEPIQKAFERAEILNKVWHKKPEEISKEELPKEEGWICRYCPFTKECNEIERR